MKTFLIALVLSLVLSSRLEAAIITTATPEWLSHKAGLVFVGVPLTAEVKHLTGDRFLNSVRFRVDKRIKGRFPWATL